MPIQIQQKPEDIQPAQSPIVFSVFESGSNAYTASGFQYTCNLYIWSGSLSNSGSYLYQLRKYPNQTGRGIFDVSRLINSTMNASSNDLVITPGSNVRHYKAEFGWQYESGSTYVTQSGGLTAVTCSNGGTLFWAYDGYNTYEEVITTINEQLYNGNTGSGTIDQNFPILTDTWQVTQSCLLTDKSQIYWNGGLPYWAGDSDYGSVPTRFVISASYTDGTKANGAITGTLGTTPQVLTASQTNTTRSIWYLGGGSTTFGIYFPGDITFNNIVPTASLDTYTIQAFSGSVQLGKTMNFEVVCQHYYEPVRVAYKNRYGVFDYFNFYKRSDITFNTNTRQYQPQLGSWNSATLGVERLANQRQNYVVDATEQIVCNSDWLEQGWNNLLKQMLVSDAIYWIKSEFVLGSSRTWALPLTIATNSLQFKTGVNNKLIQYTITFDLGRPYKFII